MENNIHAEHLVVRKLVRRQSVGVAQGDIDGLHEHLPEHLLPHLAILLKFDR